MKTKKKGFTIVELVIVIAVIAILAAVLIPTFSGIIKKANESTDTQLVRNLNTALISDNKEHKTMQSALDAAKEFGFDVDKINTKVNENEILWDSVNDCFVYKKGTVIEYIPNSKKTEEAVQPYQYWQIANELPTTQTYSIYAGKGWGATMVDNLTVGFDAGEATGIKSINYDRSAATEKRDVVIRTNGSNLTINGYVAADGLTGDEITHYGEAGIIEVIKCAGHSFYENGKVNNKLDVQQGHIVVSEQAEVADVNGTGSDVSIEIVGATITGNIKVNDSTLKISENTNIAEDSLIYASGTATVESKTNTPIYTSGSSVNASGSNVVAKAETVINSQNDWNAILDSAGQTIGSDVEFITLKCDISMSTALVLKHSVTINGNGNKIENSATRVMRVGAPDLTLKLINVNIISTSTATSDVRGISFDDVSSGSSLTLDGCTVSASFYAINIICGPSNLNVTIKNGTVAAGWAAINSYSNNSTFTIINSTLKGLNDKSESSWNNFATIVFDGFGLEHAENIGKYGSGNKLNISQSTVYASSESTNKQAWLAVQFGAQNNNILVDASTKIIDDNDIDQRETITMVPFVGIQSGTPTKYAKSYNPNSLLILGDEYIMVTYDGYLDDEVVVQPE